MSERAQSSSVTRGLCIRVLARKESGCILKLSGTSVFGLWDVVYMSMSMSMSMTNDETLSYFQLYFDVFTSFDAVLLCACVSNMG